MICGCQPYSRKGFIASPSTMSDAASSRRLCVRSTPARSSSVWKMRRVLTGRSTMPVDSPGATTTSGTCIVDW